MTTRNQRWMIGLLALLSWLMVGWTLVERSGVATIHATASEAWVLVVKLNQPNASRALSEWGELTPLTPDQTFWQLELTSNLGLPGLINRLEALPGVEYVEPNLPIKSLALTPNDPYVTSEGSWTQDFADQWALDALNLPAAWEVSTGTISTRIAVVDTGVDYTHPDIVERLWYSAGETAHLDPDQIADVNANQTLDCQDLLDPGNAAVVMDGVDDDENGYVDDVCGWDFVNDDNDPLDDQGHGTHVSGIIAAETNNATGIAGTCWDCKLLPLKSLDANGNGTNSDNLSAIAYARQNGASVINYSLGTPFFSQALADVIADAYEADIVQVAAAGNTNSTADNLMPLNQPGVIGVSALNSNGSYKAQFSNYGEAVDLVAPGVDILSLRAHDPETPTQYLATDQPVLGHADPLLAPYVVESGSSMAAPYVSGIVGLLRSAHPDWAQHHIEYALTSTARDKYLTGDDIYTGAGLPDAEAALSLAMDTTPPVAVIQTETTTTSNQQEFVANVTGQDVVAFRFRFDEGAWSQPTPVNLQISRSFESGTHTLDVIGRDTTGNWQSESNPTRFSWSLDADPPAYVRDVRISDLTADSVTFTWTAVDDPQETNLRYEIRMIPDKFAPVSDWDTEEPAIVSSVYANNGEEVSHTISGLDQLTYHRAFLRVIDGAGNRSLRFAIRPFTTLHSGEGILVQTAGIPTVYWLENSVLRPFTSALVFERLGYDWSDIKIVYHSLYHFQMGTPLFVTVQPATVVKSEDDATVYHVSDDLKLEPFVSAKAFLEQNYQWSQVQIFDSYSLSRYPLGKLLQEKPQP